jgi:very-short-patch-repair endonuclease
LLDLSAVFGERTLARTVEQSMVLGLFDGRALDAALARSSGRRGAATLGRLTRRITPEVARTRSELERRFLELVRDAGLPVPVVNGIVYGYEVDFHWPEHKLVVETDGRSVHGTPVAFERDRRRDLELELAGWHALRLTWRQVTERPSDVVALLRRRLSG